MVTFLVKILLYFLSKIYKSCGKKRADREETKKSFLPLLLLSFKFILKKAMEIAVIFLNLLSFLYAMKNIMYIIYTQKKKKLCIETQEEAHKAEMRESSKNKIKISLSFAKEKYIYKNWLNRHLSCGLAF